MQPSPQLAPTVRPTPQLVLTRELLSLAADDLTARIEAEVASNPALDWADDPTPGRFARGDSDATDDSDYADMDQRAPRSLTEHLADQLRFQTEAEIFAVAIEIVGSLDHRGWFSESLADLAERLGVAEEMALRGLAAVQSLDPPGIGARNAREALLLQLDQLEDAECPRCVLARRLVADHWRDLSQPAWPRLARALRVSEDAVRDAAAFLRDNLAPYPAQTFWGDESHAPRLTPDVLIQRDPRDPDGPFQVVVVEAARYRLCVPRAMGQAAAQVPEVEAYVARARLFIASLRQRWQTIGRITASLAEAQRDFVLRGPRHLKPMTQVQLAAELDIHESTVSRTVRDKFAELPDGRIVPLTAFFGVDDAAKAALRAIIDAETVPLTDQDLAEALAGRGHRLSRRTVAKYRDDLGIPTASRRAGRSRVC